MLSEPLAFLAGARPARPRRLRWRLTMLQRSIHVTEAAIVLLVGAWLTELLPESLGAIPLPWSVAAALVAALFMLEFGRRETATTFAGQLLLAGLAGGATLALARLPLRDDVGWTIDLLLLAGGSVTLIRLSASGVIDAMSARGCFTTRVAVVGVGPAAQRIAERLRASDPDTIQLIGAYQPDIGSVAGQAALRGDLRTLLRDGRAGVLDAIVVALEPEESESLARLRRALLPCVQDVYLSTDLLAHSPGESAVFALGTTPLLRISQRPQRGWPGACKRAADLVIGCALLLFMLPVLAVIAVAIRLETPGPVLFRQLRVGYNNQMFDILKFRSMDNRKADELAKQQTVRNDARVTRVGRVIRRLSLDELPQLFNVIAGDMSLVGPRPHAPGTSVGGKRIHTLLEAYPCRHLVRPGITGLAQVRGLRGGLATEEQVAARLQSDLEYIRDWSFWGDLRILLRTLYVELRGSNAF